MPQTSSKTSSPPIVKLPLDFAFEGFRVIRHSPLVVPFWGVVALVDYFAGKAILEAMAGNAMQALQTALAAQDIAAMTAALVRLMPAFGVLVPIAIVKNAFLSCAVFRATAGQATAFGGLRMGLDEVRQFGVSILFFLIMLGLYAATIAAGSVVGGILTVVLGAIAPALGAVGMALSLIAAIGVFCWLGARLSLSPAQSFAEKRIVMFDSWKLTEGNSLRLVIGYGIALVMAALVAFLCSGVFMAGLAIVKNGDAKAVGQVMNAAQDGGLSTILRDPAILTFVALWNVAVAPLLMAITFGAPAAAYRVLSHRAKSAENVF